MYINQFDSALISVLQFKTLFVVLGNMPFSFSSMRKRKIRKKHQLFCFQNIYVFYYSHFLQSDSFISSIKQWNDPHFSNGILTFHTM